MEIEFYDFEDELRSIIFDFERKEEKGTVLAICNPRFEFDVVFNEMEMLMMQIYFQKLTHLKSNASATDLKLDKHGILMRNAQYDGDAVLFDLVIQRKEETGFKKTTSKILFEKEMLTTLNAIINTK